MTVDPIDLGAGHTLRFVQWAPDRDLNPQYGDMPDVKRWGAIVAHPHPATGEECRGFVTFDGEVQRRVEPNRTNRWQVESWEPLTISPSVLCECGDHGFIRQGRWVAA